VFVDDLVLSCGEYVNVEGTTGIGRGFWVGQVVQGDVSASEHWATSELLTGRRTRQPDAVGDQLRLCMSRIADAKWLCTEFIVVYDSVASTATYVAGGAWERSADLVAVFGRLQAFIGRCDDVTTLLTIINSFRSVHELAFAGSSAPLLRHLTGQASGRIVVFCCVGAPASDRTVLFRTHVYRRFTRSSLQVSQLCERRVVVSP
jgi:hypothetical protein